MFCFPISVSFQMSSYARVYVRIIYKKKTKEKFPWEHHVLWNGKTKRTSWGGQFSRIKRQLNLFASWFVNSDVCCNWVKKLFFSLFYNHSPFQQNNWKLSIFFLLNSNTMQSMLLTLDAILLHRCWTIVWSLSGHHMITGLLSYRLLLHNWLSRWYSRILPVAGLGWGRLDWHITLRGRYHFSWGGGNRIPRRCGWGG